MDQSLQDISAEIYADDNALTATESKSEERPNGLDKLTPQSCPRDDAVTNQIQVRVSTITQAFVLLQNLTYGPRRCAGAVTRQTFRHAPDAVMGSA